MKKTKKLSRYFTLKKPQTLEDKNGIKLLSFGATVLVIPSFFYFAIISFLFIYVLTGHPID